ncbi:MAG: bifunctional diaminohydroxyphosphoribosylaminopyrimidine deaminase/5-amino-6-(5-phosphoribosylamino)uracil reductase RibD [Deltaproteobacteria bacterium]|nr:MAG: bifunctional diaminohydroxyphosphoribosylaminopyrimidine deaminase/5-amino-6-(5-phosphoribosylamino)uracil reductase RibD [Deltaproteobacteria bacterium]
MSRPVEHERWMAEACAEAEKGLGNTAPNPPVGCILVRGGRIVGRGYHRRAGAPHAEIEAIRSAGTRARGAVAYVTLEPCCHHGRTPPCTAALVEAGVRAVVAGVRDPNPQVSGRGLARLRRAGIETTCGVLEERCEELIRGFRCWVRTGMPWVELKLAASLDGRIATRTGASKWISSPPSRRRVQHMRARADAVLVGVGTVLADDPRLTCRIAGARQPLRVVLDRGLRTPPRARVVAGRGHCLIVAAPGADARRRRALEDAGAEVVEIDCGRAAGWRRLLRELGRREVLELLIEGGGQVAASAVRARVVNEATIFYNPRLIGADGVALFGRLGVSDPGRAVRAKTCRIEYSGDDLMWVGRFVR